MTMTKKRSVNVVTLGCSKNLVDSERVLSMLSDAGFEAYHQTEEDTDIVVINTCGFIGDAKEESVNTILEFCEAKKRGEKSPRVVTTPSHHAYIKISEGCNRFCAFCAIPLITGRHHSRPMEEIEAEVGTLAAKGVREFNIIAQDLSSYGLDLYGGHRLAQLVDRLADIHGVERIRLHYAYPADFPMDILDVMARRDNVCKYLDIALQHISDHVLTNMRRHISADETRRLLAEIRRRVPGIHIRTTLMVGFPGEEEADFEELMDFVREQRFERMGAFAYCEEEGTFAANNLPDLIPEDVKQERLSRLMALQEEISLEIQQEKKGKEMDVIIDSEEEDYYVGRTEFDSPEVDPEVLVKKTRDLNTGDIVKVRITETLPFELIGEPLP